MNVLLEKEHSPLDIEMLKIHLHQSFVACHNF